MNGGKPRIILVAPVPPPNGGIANWTEIVLRGLGQYTDWKVSHIDTAPRKRITEGRTIINRVFGGLTSIVRTLMSLRKELSDQTDCVVHIATSASLALFRDRVAIDYLRRHGVPAVYHLHFGRTPEILATESWEKKLLLNNIKRCSKVIAIDGFTKAAIDVEVGGVKTRYIENPIWLDSMHEFEKDGVGDEKKITYVGWVVPTKGIGELCSAWRIIRKTHPDWRLEIIGPYDNKVAASLLGDDWTGIDLTGELPHDQAMRRLAKSSIAVLPSYTEGFPNFVLEAMLLGKAVVGTKVGAMPEMLGEGRGLIIPPADVDTLASALEQLICDESRRREMGALSMNYVRKQCSTQRVVEQYEKVWIEALHEYNT